MTMIPTRPDFLAALQVINEGRRVHSRQEIEHAKTMLKPVAHYQWPQLALLAFCFVSLGVAVGALRLHWPWSADIFLSAMIGAFGARAIMHIPRIRTVFAPDGFEIDDVTEAARHVFA